MDNSRHGLRSVSHPWQLRLQPASRTKVIQVYASNVSPQAAFTVDKGLHFASNPVWFNFDASGVSDGEDSVSQLQVRWDYEDDGSVWDMAASGPYLGLGIRF